MYINTIYPGFMGEVNVYGIGSPCVFLRLSGCNLRCYKKTLGILCDTPEALEMKSGEDLPDYEIIKRVKAYGRDLVCITGGEPLMQDIFPIVWELNQNHDMRIVVETNGSIEIPDKYFNLAGVSFVVDYKAQSAGVCKMVEENWKKLRPVDFIKFVLYNYDDFKEFVEWHKHYRGTAKVAVGLFWGEELSYTNVMEFLSQEGINDVYLNVQAHKLEMLYDNTDDVSKIFIPKNL